MADRLYTKFFQYVVKFPDGVKPPKGYKPADEWESYIGVEMFNKVYTPPEFRVDDGFQGNFKAMPCNIMLSEMVMGAIRPLLNKPLKPDWEVELIELAKEEKDEPSVAYKCEFEGVRFQQTSETSIMITYNKFESEKFKPEGPPDRDGYDFLEGKWLG